MADLYSLKKADLVGLDRMGDKFADNLLVAHFWSMDAFMAAAIENLTEIPEVGPKTAQGITDWQFCRSHLSRKKLLLSLLHQRF